MEGIEDLYPLTASQEGMLFHTVSSPDSGVYVQQVHCFLSGGIRPEKLHRTWELLLQRHPVLRTAFLWDGLDDPLQVVRTEATLPWEVLDWSAQDPVIRGRNWTGLLEDDRKQGFLLEEAPLLRIRLIRFTESAWRLLLTFHHIVMDGWSFHSLLDEFYGDYQSLLEGKTPAHPSRPLFREAVGWRQTHSPPGEEAFWRRHLEGFEATPLPLPEQNLEPGFLEKQWWLAEENSQKLYQLCQRERVTLSTLVEAAWAMVLAARSLSDDVLFGTTMSGRTANLADSDAILGPLINVVPKRFELPEKGRLCDWLRQLQDRAGEFQTFQFSSLAKIRGWAEMPADTPLFESLLVFENYPTTEPEWSDFEVSGLQFREQSNYPLAVMVVPGRSLRFILLVDGAVFDRDTLLGLGEQLKLVLEQMSQSLSRELSSYLLTNRESQQRLLTQGQGEGVGPQKDVLDLFQHQARRSPEGWAIRSEQADLTYRELEDASGRLAFALREQGVKPGQRVGIFLPRSWKWVVATLAILKTGAAYVPLPSQHPAESLRFMIEDCGVELVVSDNAPGLEGVRWVAPEQSGPTSTDFPKGDLAYVLFTSGSTGRPKGVCVSRSNLAYSTAARTRYYGKYKRFLMLSSFAVDSSVAGLFGTLTQGGTLVIPEEREELDPFSVLDLVERHEVTHTLCIPSLWQALLEEADPFQVCSMKAVILAGEVCPPTVIEEHYGILPEAILYNEYGPTEATVWATVFEIPSELTAPSVPIGRPIPGTRLEVRDHWGRLSPSGTVGELVIQGPTVAAGYSGASSSSFLEENGARLYRSGDLVWWGADGSLRFWGRKDQQLKVRGYRLEAAAIESVLLQLPGVEELAVASPDGRRLVAYLVGSLEPSNLRTCAMELLPEYAVPTQIEVLTELPRTTGGKIARRSLPELIHSPSPSPEPRTPGEETLVRIWEDVLDIDSVGIHDNFFELGGDSLLSIRVVSKARAEGLQLHPQDLLSAQTIAKLSLDARNIEGTQEATLPHQDIPLTPIQHWFFAAPLKHPEHWNISYWFRCTELLELPRLQKALRVLVKRHDALQLSFHKDGEEWCQRLQLESDLTASSHLVALLDQGTRTRFEEQFHRDFRLHRAPLIKVALLQDESGCQEMLMAVHHLVMDYVSWPLLMTDLETIYQEGEPLARPTPYWRYAEHLQDIANSDELNSELTFWRSQSGGEPLPMDFPGASNTEGEAQTVRQTVSVSCPSPPPGTPDLPCQLLTSLALTLQRVFGLGEVRIGLEGVGRVSPTLDVSQTIGWFNNYYPLLFQAQCGSPAYEVARRTQQLLAAVPENGRGHGILRYLVNHEDLREPEPQVMFTYLGRLGSWQDTVLFKEISGPTPVVRHPSNARCFLLEVYVRLEDDGNLAVEWRYGTQIYKGETIAALMEAFEGVLAELQC